MSATDGQPRAFRVFLSGVIQGSHTDSAHHSQNYRDELRALLAEVHPDAEVICPVELNPGSAGYEETVARRSFYSELELAATAEVTIAYVPVASMGTAVEMYRAHSAGRIVFTISPMAQNWAVRFLSREVFSEMAAFQTFVRAGGIALALADERAEATA